MKETEKIIEMAKKMTDENQTDVAEALSHLFVSLAECLYDDGYRKQSEGTWRKATFLERSTFVQNVEALAGITTSTAM